MLPIATLPAAGLLLRLGQDDLLGRWDATKKVAAVLAAAGGGLFDWLPLLFAVGIAVGFARRGDGSTGVAAVVGFVVFNKVVQVFAPISGLEGFKEGWYLQPIKWPYSVLGGVIVGLVTAVLWQRFHRVKLPPYLAFFGGRRFVPIINSLALLVLGVIFGLIFPPIDSAIQHLGNAVTDAPVVGGGVYGLLNRLLLPVGLHQLINVPVWFIFKGGDITNFFNGDPHAGAFTTGFFPIFMFALPAAALAIWQTARPEQKKVVGGIMIAAALTSFLTGVTEPIEFAFMFVAWPLYLMHAVLTGISLAVCNALGIHLGFSFSAGAIDFALNAGAPAAAKAWLLIPIGLVFAVIYYFVFRWVITKWNLRTPGREEEGVDVTDTTSV
ncbi:PTS N-acetylglucosamine transporter subunit IIBC [Amycolatopsis sp. RM579]|uniref:PTS N-acetylglucosamine transporter subunit IIBC n=2 Tax=Amycolatopsis pithecellobii TaxID=664692 RepID=A0A6N7ZC89_9PSEU|nr:PTS N-acetylglucosamine transporter subunit IIBC [Amycolatopsis pithecellobii]